jgi:excisionase family DNA binding protein
VSAGDDSNQAAERAAIATTSPWLNGQQAAAYVGKSKQFLFREIHAGRLRAARIGGRGEILTRAEWLDEFVQAQAIPISINRRRA